MDISKEAVAIDEAWLYGVADNDPKSPALVIARRLRALSARVEELEAERDALSEYSFEATKAITGFTAGGSEFFAGKLPDGRYKADLSRCVKYVRDTKEALQGQVVNQYARGRLQGLNEAIAAIDERFTLYEGDPSDANYKISVNELELTRKAIDALKEPKQ